MINYQENLSQLKSTLREDDEFIPFLSDISLPFIPAFDSGFDVSKNKTVLIGQETAGWRAKKLKDLVFGDLDINEHIQDSKNRYQELYNTSSSRLPFLNFLDKLKQEHEPVQWLNFYICDYKKSSFNQMNTSKKNIKLYNVIKDFSIDNLVLQLNRLQPKNIFFVGSYHGNWQQLKSIYAHQEEIIHLKNEIDNFSLRFWNNQTLVIRLPHPASRVKDKTDIQKLALHYFHLFNYDANQDINLFKQLIISDLKFS